LYVDTDAPLPSEDPQAPPPLFDRARIDVVPPGETDPCGGCTHDFDLATPILAERKASVGLRYPPNDRGWTARVRIYWSAFASPSGDPDPASTIDRTFALPTLASEGIVELTALLSTNDVGGGPSDTPVDPSLGRPTSSPVGTWPGAQRVPCADSARAGEVCIPGGAFWMGTPLPMATVRDVALPPRLVVLSPFWLDDREVTVADYRRFDPARPLQWSGNTAGTSPTDWCLFTSVPGPHEDAPLNCISWNNARAYCRSRGADLPTEAQYEYAAGGSDGTTFPWGEDLPTCDGAIWGRGGFGSLSALDHACPRAMPGQAPVPVGHAGRGLDVAAFEAGAVYDLGGNLDELTLDAWQNGNGSCWSAVGIYRDPHCNSSSATALRAVRGGAWSDPGSSLVRFHRLAAIATNTTPQAGFRCARPSTAQ
jgi:formylglycine-generating enzyme required for sulfatase activity